MRNKLFEVPIGFIAEFAEAIDEKELTNNIQGVNEEGHILINIQYEKGERADVFELAEMLDDYLEENEDEE